MLRLLLAYYISGLLARFTRRKPTPVLFFKVFVLSFKSLVKKALTGYSDDLIVVPDFTAKIKTKTKTHPKTKFRESGTSSKQVFILSYYILDKLFL